MTLNDRDIYTIIEIWEFNEIKHFCDFVKVISNFLK